MARSLDIAPILKALNENAEALKAGRSSARENVIAQARSLITTLETPLESILWLTWAEPNRYVCSRLAIDLGLFEKLDEEDGRPKSLSELAAVKNAEPELVGRILRHLAAMDMIVEVSKDTFRPGYLSHLLAIRGYRAAVNFLFDCAGPAYAKLPEYLASTHYKNPTDGKDGPFQYGHGINVHAFEWVSSRPHVLQELHHYMSGLQGGKILWYEEGFYPIEERLITGLKTDGDHGAIVDVGGSAGHAMKGFQAKHPDWNGRLIVQDLPEVIQQAPKDSQGIDMMVHDFFTPQPINGARVYYLQNILHDWPDDRCLDILKNLKTAMDPGYSKILIDEQVLPNQGADWKKAACDIFMMVLAAGQERTESHWYDLIQKAGLKIAGIWNKRKEDQSIIEVVLEQDFTMDCRNRVSAVADSVSSSCIIG